ncbi:ATP-binding cassette domain-containing protein [Bradyrhizobium sp. 149]|uniref:ABC transporter ATP-binding protein n=1 Tax=Bradyrhizobium sp. 149 TaxID=2782624 RepID=UPI001FF93425|nr:ATP-binding cassette domain-containing protein [Bradyrhizobium sp. 149]MCK1655325.1 ATP-binding cassette domain-containing protein [Bradyrhizobium sp. 149]
MLGIVDLTVSIEGVRVLRNVGFELQDGKTTILIGRNGAGKTTTLRAIMGLVACDSGTIWLDGEHLEALPGYQRARLGIGYAPEDRRLIPDMSVEENMRLPMLALNLPKRETTDRLDEIYAMLPELHVMRARAAGSISGGQGKMVALGRALTVARKVLLLDEPFQGLAPALALEYARTLGQLRKHRPDLAILITESTPALLDRIADRTLQIERGEITDSSNHEVQTCISSSTVARETETIVSGSKSMRS